MCIPRWLLLTKMIWPSWMSSMFSILFCSAPIHDSGSLDNICYPCVWDLLVSFFLMAILVCLRPMLILRWNLEMTACRVALCLCIQRKQIILAIYPLTYKDFSDKIVKIIFIPASKYYISYWTPSPIAYQWMISIPVILLLAHKELSSPWRVSSFIALWTSMLTVLYMVSDIDRICICIWSRHRG